MLKEIFVGYKLVNKWPALPKLNMVLKEGYLIRPLKLLALLLPPLLAFYIVWYFIVFYSYSYIGNKISLVVAIAVGVFLLLLPIIGYYKLGVLALTKLPQQHLELYKNICLKNSLEPKFEAKYWDLLLVIDKVLKQENSDKSFIDEI